jgi:rod shape-determining protein MreC
MDHTPPPFFNRGPGPFVRVALFALLSLLFMVLDARLQTLGVIRQTLAVILYPLQRAADAPFALADGVADYFTIQSTLRRENEVLRQRQLQDAVQLQRHLSVEAENAYLRQLLGIRQRLATKTVAAEVFYSGLDPFARKILVDKGASQGIEAGQAVVDDIGVIGQVTRVLPFSSEVTLITDKNQAVPVQMVRTGLRAIVFGGGRDGTLDLPYLALNTDIRVGDVLVTSGIDGTYPAGQPVATVAQIDRNAAYNFAKITCQPSAGVHHHKQLLILSAPAPAAPADAPKEKGL